MLKKNENGSSSLSFRPRLTWNKAFASSWRLLYTLQEFDSVRMFIKIDESSNFCIRLAENSHTLSESLDGLKSSLRSMKVETGLQIASLAKTLTRSPRVWMCSNFHWIRVGDDTNSRLVHSVKQSFNSRCLFARALLFKPRDVLIFTIILDNITQKRKIETLNTYSKYNFTEWDTTPSHGYPQYFVRFPWI